MRRRRIALHPVIEEPVARQVMVDADDVGRARIVGDGAQPVAQPQPVEPLPEGMVGAHPAAQQVPAGPPPQIVERRLIGQRRRREGAAEILRLHQASGGLIRRIARIAAACRRSG